MEMMHKKAQQRDSLGAFYLFGFFLICGRDEDSHPIGEISGVGESREEYDNAGLDG